MELNALDSKICLHELHKYEPKTILSKKLAEAIRIIKMWHLALSNKQ
jgi:hypothetical protein